MLGGVLVLRHIFLFLLALFAMLLVDGFVYRQQMLIQKWPKFRKDDDWIIFFFHWVRLNESIDHDRSEFKKWNLEEAYLRMHHEWFVVVDATHFVCSVHPLSNPWNFILRELLSIRNVVIEFELLYRFVLLLD